MLDPLSRCNGTEVCHHLSVFVCILMKRRLTCLCVGLVLQRTAAFTTTHYASFTEVALSHNPHVNCRRLSTGLKTESNQHTTFSETALKQMSRRELVSIAKREGVRANVKSVEIISMLLSKQSWSDQGNAMSSAKPAPDPVKGPKSVSEHLQRLRSELGDDFLSNARRWVRLRRPRYFSADLECLSITRGASNFEAICGFSGEQLQLMQSAAMLSVSNCGPRSNEQRWNRVLSMTRRLNSWQRVSRGRDLFVKGMGKFSVMEEYEVATANLEANEHRPFAVGPKRMEALQRAGLNNTGILIGAPDAVFEDYGRRVASLNPDRASSSRWARRLKALALRSHAQEHGYYHSLYLDWSRCIVTPGELAASAYFPQATEVWTRSGHDTSMEHLCQILSRHEDSRERKHLIRFQDYWNDAQNALQLDELAQSVLWPLDGEKMQPRQLLNRMSEAATASQLGPDIHFSHLNNISDGIIDSNNLQLQVLRSRHRISQVAKTLKNCARMYSRRVEHRDYMLVALVDTETHKAQALAGWDPGQPTVWNHAPVLSMNRRAEADVKSRFDTFLPRLQAALQEKVFAC